MADTAARRRATSSEVAAALGLKAATIQLRARQGRIPFGLTPGGHRRFDVDEVRAAFAKRPAAVRTLPCPKCASTGTWMTYCDGCILRPTSSLAGGRYRDDYCADGDPEHFHRGCKVCSYRWRTDDVIDASVRCRDRVGC